MNHPNFYHLIKIKRSSPGPRKVQSSQSINKMNDDVHGNPQSLTKSEPAKLYSSTQRPYQRKIPLSSVFTSILLTSSILFDLNHIAFDFLTGKVSSTHDN